MADSTTAVEIFKPLDQDYALTGLRKLFGCMVDQLWKSAGTCSDTSNVLVQGLAWFNGGVLILAGIVACYLLYSLVADTANDGEAFGRSTDTRYTLLRTGIGAALFLPISERPLPRATPRDPGWRSGARASATPSGRRSLGPTSPACIRRRTSRRSAPPDFAVRKTVADALRARTYGYVCKYSLENASKILTQAEPPSDHPDTSTDTTTAGWAPERRAGHAPVLSRHDGLLPELDVPVRLRLLHREPADDAASRGVGQSADQSYAQFLYNLTQTAATAALTTAWTKIDTAANSIAVKVTGGDNPDSAAQRNSEDIRAAIAQAVDDATQTLTSSLTSQITSTSSTLEQAKTQYLDLSKQNGWITAVLWQRSMASIYAKLTINRELGPAQLDPSRQPGRLPSRSSPPGARATTPPSTRRRRDMDYIVTFDTYFTTLGQATAPALATETVGEPVERGPAGRRPREPGLPRGPRPPSRSQRSTTWRDPYLEIQKSVVPSDHGLWGLGATTAATRVTSALVPGGSARSRASRRPCSWRSRSRCS